MRMFTSPVRIASLVLVLVGAGLLGLIILGRGTLNVALPLVFLMLGVTAAENFANGHAAFRILYGHPARPLSEEEERDKQVPPRGHSK